MAKATARRETQMGQPRTLHLCLTPHREGYFLVYLRPAEVEKKRSSHTGGSEGHSYADHPRESRDPGREAQKS